jgi:hypothetical protein
MISVAAEPYSSDVVILSTVKRVFLSSYFRSRARKGPGTEEPGSPVVVPVCDRSSPGQDRRCLKQVKLNLKKAIIFHIVFSAQRNIATGSKVNST